MTPITPIKYIRKPFAVDAIEVTAENIEQVAIWCGGEVRTSDLSKTGGKEGVQHYIKVAVKRPLNDRQTRAYYGDWVLSAGAGFKVYTQKAFVSSFEVQVDNMIKVVTHMDERVAREEKAEIENLVGLPVVPSDPFSG